MLWMESVRSIDTPWGLKAGPPSKLVYSCRASFSPPSPTLYFVVFIFTILVYASIKLYSVSV